MAGNPGPATATPPLEVQVKIPSIYINPISDDNYINALEHNSTSNLTVSGTTADAKEGMAVRVTFDGVDYTTTVNADGTWSISVPAAVIKGLSDGSVLVDATIDDGHGNIGHATQTTVIVDTVAPSVTIDAVTSDNTLNNDELANLNGQNITGTASTSEAGRTITVTVTGDGGSFKHDYTATIGVDGKWSITMSSDDLALLHTGVYSIEAKVTDAAGNSATKSKTFNVDQTLPTITIDDFTGDNQVNKTEQSQAQLISGTTTGVAAGKTVTVILGDGSAAAKTYTATVDSNGDWSVSVAPADWAAFVDGGYTIKASVDSASGNHASTSEAIIIDTSAPTISFDVNVAGTDNVVNMTEQANGIHVTGTTTAEAGQTVTLVFNNGGKYSATVGTDGTWSVDLPASEFAALADGDYTMTAVVTDKAGNSSDIASKTVTVSDDTWTIAIDPFTGDLWLNAAEAVVTQQITGTTNAPDGQTVTITLNGQTYTATVADGKWSCDVSTADLAALTEGTNYTITASVTNPIGNTGQATQNFTVDTTAPDSVVTIVSYTDDAGDTKGTFSAGTASDDKTPVINGTLSKTANPGDRLAIFRDGVLVGYATINGTTWSFADNLATLADGTYKYTAQYIDAAGNTGAISGEFDYILDTAVPTYAQMTAMSTTDTTPVLRGTFTGEFREGYTLEVKVNGKTYSSTTGAVVVDIASQTWYLQIPDSDAMAKSATAYKVDMTVTMPSGVDPSTSSIMITGDPIFNNPTTISSTFPDTIGGSVTLNSRGEWEFSANGSVVNASSRTSWSPATINLGSDKYSSSTFFDYDRDGDMDIISQTGTISSIYISTNNGADSYTPLKITTSAAGATYRGGTIAIDINGDGYTDFAMGDFSANSGVWFINNGNGTFTEVASTSGKEPNTHTGKVTDWAANTSVSGVDLDNDGKVDITYETADRHYASMHNNGDGSFNWQQWTSDIWFPVISNATWFIAPLTWADFNNDGYMDLWINSYGTSNGYNAIAFNNGDGTLGTPISWKSTGVYTHGIIAIDWNHDGYMDIANIVATGTAKVFLNNGTGSNFTSVNIGTSYSSVSATSLSLDYDWDGARDVLITCVNGSTQLVHNPNAVANGTSLHFKIIDKNGINCFFGNTVNLYDSTGKRVSTQILNPQAGVGNNDSSAIIDFYGLDPNQTYHLELLYQENGVSKTISQDVNANWGGIQAGAANECHVMTVESDSASNNGTISGTGYNDVLMASAGTDTYNGQGGWEYTSGTGVWSATGGMDVIDYKSSTVGVTIDLSQLGAQNTGFNTAILVNIEGFAGSNQADHIKGSSLDNQIEGRGGDDIIDISNGGHDTLLYKLISSGSNDGGVGHDVVSGFNVAAWEGPANSGRVDIHELIKGSGYSGTGSAHYVDGVATLDASTGNIEDFVKVVQNGDNVDIKIDRDGTGAAHEMTTVVTLINVHTDLATLLANHQLTVV